MSFSPGTIFVCIPAHLYQLTSESGHTYAYDSLNNRLQKDGEEIQINNLNQDVTHFEYNRNGNPIAQGNTTYSYDALDRIISLESPPLYQTYTYDFFNRCISKTSTYKDNSNNRHFLYDGQNEIGALDENLNPIEFRVLGPTPHAEIGASIAIELQKSIYTPIHDLQGNIAVLIPHFSDQPTYYHYTAFGEEASSKPNPNPWKYSSKRTDEQTGLVYFGRRFYSPTHGRWLTPDPSGFTDGMNLYAYLHNDPLIHFDEYGLFTHGYRESGSQLYSYASQTLQSTTMNILNNPRFQGSMQAFGGLAEASFGGGMILANKGFSPLGWTVLTHGIDHFFTGLNIASTGISRDSVTSQLLQKTGVPPQYANIIDGSISTSGMMKGAYVIQSSRATASISFTPNNAGIKVPSEKIKFNFTKAADKHMFEIERRIPVHILDDIIKSPIAVMQDPRGTSNAMMHYSQIWRNGKLYNVELVYNKHTNTIMHFKYSPDPMGPLKEIK